MSFPEFSGVTTALQLITCGSSQKILGFFLHALNMFFPAIMNNAKSAATHRLHVAFFPLTEMVVFVEVQKEIK